MLKYILLLSLFTLGRSGIINCQLEAQGQFIFHICKNNTWTDKPEYIALVNKTVLASPFSANSVWMDKDNNVIGVSDKTDAIFNINGEEWPNEQRQGIMIRILHSVPVPVDVHPPPSNYIKNEAFEKLAADMRDAHSECRWRTYLETHLHNHENILEWCMEKYMNPHILKFNTKTMDEIRAHITDELMHADRAAPILCNVEDVEDCQFIKTCDCKEGDKSSDSGARKCTYTFNAFKDMSNSGETPYHNCENWTGFNTLQEEQEKLAKYRMENGLVETF